jgi:hypothetical protein
LVDAAFLALALLRAPQQLWQKLDSRVRSNLLKALRATRTIQPPFNNWLLFSAVIEAFFCRVAESWDRMRIDYAMRQLDEWYKGDGIYGDGPHLHCDYYNSFVIQPFLQAILDNTKEWQSFRQRIVDRAQRFTVIQERSISPDGTYPPVGRSLAYRCGAFHHLANAAYRGELPSTLAPAQVRSALTSVIRRSLDVPETFDGDGWLTIGFCGHQPAIAESYVSTGSTYLCTTAFLPLGLPTNDPFWTDARKNWTSRELYSGHDLPADHALPDV